MHASSHHHTCKHSTYNCPQLSLALGSRAAMAVLFLLLLLCISCNSLVNAVCEEDGRPVYCSPPVQDNLLSGLQPLTNDSCGQDGPQRFCIITSENRTSCEYCSDSVPAQSHPPSLVTDDNVTTFWVSFVSPALLTFPLSSTFHISSVSITFLYGRPESYAILVSTDGGETFQPLRYYSVSCSATYGIEEDAESDIVCSSQQAGGRSTAPVVFQPLSEGYPVSAAMATDIQIQLDIFPTDTDFYAISNVTVSGRCFCNGHSERCGGSVSESDVECVECQHGTSGRECEVCSEDYQSLPWAPSSLANPASCLNCPACYDQVTLEFNKTQYLLASLLSRLNSSSFSSDQLPSDLLTEIKDYQTIVEMMLERALDLRDREKNLSSLINTVSMETDELDDMIGQLERNVSLSEDGLERVRGSAESAVQLLRRLNESVSAVERSVRGDLLSNLSLANQRLREIENIFNDLVNLSLLAENTSTIQVTLAQDLLNSANESFVTANMILDLLSTALDLQNITSSTVDQLEVEVMKTESVFTNASSGLSEIQVTVSSVLGQSRELLERLRDTSITDNDTAADLEADIIKLRNLTAELVEETQSASNELEVVEEEVERVRVRAGLLLTEAEEINMLAIELLSRAHAAFSFANETVEEGNLFINSVEQLLLQLQQRLENSTGLVEGLEEVVQNLLSAEELVIEAEEEEKRKREEVNSALITAEEAVETFEIASQLTAQAIQVAQTVRDEAGRILFNATLLANNANELAANVTQLDEKEEELEGVAIENAELIATATEEAENTLSEARRLQEDINTLTVVLEELEVELNSTELLPSNKLTEVGAMVMGLETQAERNQLTLDSLQNQVEELEESSDELREKHVQLQQHRDLLQSILNNIQNLDCRNQFQSI